MEEEQEKKSRAVMGKNGRRACAALLAAAVLFVPVGGRPAGAQSGASLFFSPSSGTYAVGKSFSVGVFVSSRDQAMNAFEIAVKFPGDKLEVTSLSKSGSVATLWVQDPSYSNAAGTVSLVGVVLNPGFRGASGRLITITFRAKAEGTAAVSFSSASVLANDGAGTNIFSGGGSATYTIAAAAVPPKKAPPPEETAPQRVAPPEETARPNPPQIKSYPREIVRGKPIAVDGLTYPDSDVNVWFQHGDGEPVGQRVRSDGSGFFRLTYEGRLRAGTYTIRAEVVDVRGVESGPSESVTTVVLLPFWIRFLRQILAGIVPFFAGIVAIFTGIVPSLNILLFLLLLILFYHLWRKHPEWRSRVRREIREARASLSRAVTMISRAVTMLRTEARRAVRFLERVHFRHQLHRKNRSSPHRGRRISRTRGHWHRKKSRRSHGT